MMPASTPLTATRALLALAMMACTPPLPSRSSPELVPADPPPAERGLGYLTTDSGGGLETGPGEMTAPIPDAVAVGGIYRVFHDGTALVCSDGLLARWDGSAWTEVPFPSRDNPSLDDEPDRCEAFDAWSATEALFVTGSGHTCRYDGATVDCVDTTAGVTRDVEPGVSGTAIVLADAHAFFVNEDGRLSIFVLERGASPSEAQRIGSVGSTFAQRINRVPGAEQIVVDRDAEDGAPRVFDVEGEVGPIELDPALLDEDRSLRVEYATVPVAAGDAFVVVERTYVTYECSGSEDDPICESTLHWSEIVVLRAVDGAATEVAHLGVEGQELTLRRSRLVDGALRIETSDGWLRIP